MWFAVLCLLFSLASVENSLLKIYFPPSSSGNYPRLRLNQAFSPLKEFTACMWIKPHLFQRRFSTFLSYATSRSNNEFALCLSNDGNKIKVGVNIATSYLEIKCNDITWELGEWYHVCASWFSSNGRLSVFTNGRQCYNYTYDKDFIAIGDSIQGGGVFVFGQDQDNLDSKYEADQAWVGDIADVNMWDEALTKKQVRDAGKCNGLKRKGNIIAGLRTSMTALGVSISETNLCESIAYARFNLNQVVPTNREVASDNFVD